MRNNLKDRIAKGQISVGVSCRLGSPHSVEMLAMAGFDYLFLDQQHGFTSFDALAAMLQGAARTDTTPIVRVPDNDGAHIGQVLDMGAEGIVVPSVNSREEAEQAVAACRYAPHGTRSWYPMRGGLLDASPREVEENILCIAIIETAAGLANVREIAGVPGIDGIYIGPADLGLGLGADSIVDIDDEILVDPVKEIIDACAANDIVACINGDPVSRANQGFKMVTAGSDDGFVKAGIERVRRSWDLALQ